MKITIDFLNRHKKRYQGELKYINDRYYQTKDIKELDNNFNKLFELLKHDTALYYGNIWEELWSNEFYLNNDLRGILLRIPNNKEYKDLKRIIGLYNNEFEKANNIN